MAEILYEDGRVGLAAATLLATGLALDAVLSAITPSDTEAASDLSATIARAKSDCPTAGTIDDLTAIAIGLVSTARDVGRLSADPDSAAPAWLAAAAACAAEQTPTTVSPATAAARRLADAIAGLAEAACLGEYAIALSQGSFADRASALAAKAALSVNADAPLERIARVCGEDVWSATATAIERAADYLVDRSLDLRPVVMVATPESLPSVAIAWALYGDPSRAAELVDRNRVGTPAFMPTAIEALAP